MKRQSLIKGTLILGLAGIFTKFLGLFFRWPLIMLIGDEGLGYYQMSYPLYTFFIAIASGMPVAISKMVSEKKALGDERGARTVLKKAMLLMIIMGGSFSILMLVFSRQLIQILKWDSKSYYSMIGVAFAPFFISILASLRGFFQGLQNMTPTAVSQIIEQIGRVIIGVGLAYILLPRGIEYSAGGAAFGAAAGGILGGVYLIWVYFKNEGRINLRGIKSDTDIMGKLLYIAIPVSLGSTAGTIMSLIDSIFVPQNLLRAGFTYKQSTILYAQLTGKAFVIVNIPLTISMALCYSLVPMIADSYILNRKREVFNKIELAFKMSAVIALPSLFGLFFMSNQILNLLLPGHAEGYMIMKYLSLCLPFVIFSQISTAILQGIGRYMQPVINLIIGCIVKIIFTFVFVPMPGINIYGAIIGTVAGYMVSAVLNIIALKKYVNMSLSFYDIIIKPAFASVLMIIGVVFIYIRIYNKTMNNAVSSLVSIFSGVVIYVVLVFAFGIFKFTKVKDKIISRKRIF